MNKLLKVLGLLILSTAFCQSKSTRPVLASLLKRTESAAYSISNIRNLANKVKSTGGCLLYATAVSRVQQTVRYVLTEDDVGRFANAFCTLIHMEKPYICAGLTNSLKHEIYTSVVHTPYKAEEICALLIPTCASALHPSHNWTVAIPFPKSTIYSPKTPKVPLNISRVLHISDMHVDHQYAEGSNANCDQLLCCRVAYGLPDKPSDAAGYWGDYRNCDIPIRTLENMLAHIKNTHKVDYVIWTGDDLPNDSWQYTRKEILHYIRTTCKLIQKYFGDIPVFPTLGNHDSVPLNSFPIPQVKGKHSISWLYNGLVKEWSRWLPPDALLTVKKGGYYSVLVNPGLRIISINTNYCNRNNLWLLLNTTDPAGQLAWLVQELQNAEDKREKVHILGHIPPGLQSWCLAIWSSNYNKIINRYENTVTAQFFGHTHRDEFEIFYDRSGPVPRATNVAYIAPSVTTWFGLNPGYRIYTEDGDYPESSRAILDSETYFMNLTKANILRVSEWEFEYSAKEAYRMKSLAPSEWDSLTKKFEINDQLFQTFYRFYVKRSDFLPHHCDDECKTIILCQLRRSNSLDSSTC